MSKPYSYLSKTEALDSVHFAKENSEKDYCEMVQNIIQQKPFGDRKFYLYQFWKRVEDASGVKKMYHQPRLTRPDPIPGTTLLKCDPKDPGSVTIVWTLPNEENFGMYKQGRMFSDPFVWGCIEKYKSLQRDIDNLQKRIGACMDNSKLKYFQAELEDLWMRNDLTRPDPEDPSDEAARAIYREMKKR